MKTRAGVLWGLHEKWSIDEIDVDPPKAGEVIVQWKVAGLCHSDEHLVTGDMVPPAEALAAMGMGNARALFAAHNDEGYAHLHIVASKINPDTGRAYDLKGNYLKLSRWAEAYERDHSGGVVCTRREEANPTTAKLAEQEKRDLVAFMRQL